MNNETIIFPAINFTEITVTDSGDIDVGIFPASYTLKLSYSAERSTEEINELSENFKKFLKENFEINGRFFSTEVF